MKRFALGYEINWSNNTVTVTKDFYKAANEFGSDAFNTMMDLRKLGLDVVVRKIADRKPSKHTVSEARSFGRPTYRQMMIHINNCDDAAERIPQFDKVCCEARAHKNAYQYVLEWFKDTYPNFNAVPTFSSELEIVNDPNGNEENAVAC